MTQCPSCRRCRAGPTASSCGHGCLHRPLDPTACLLAAPVHNFVGPCCQRPDTLSHTLPRTPVHIFVGAPHGGLKGQPEGLVPWDGAAPVGYQDVGAWPPAWVEGKGDAACGSKANRGRSSPTQIPAPLLPPSSPHAMRSSSPPSALQETAPPQHSQDGGPHAAQLTQGSARTAGQWQGSGS